MAKQNNTLSKFLIGLGIVVVIFGFFIFSSALNTTGTTAYLIGELAFILLVILGGLFLMLIGISIVVLKTK